MSPEPEKRINRDLRPLLLLAIRPLHDNRLDLLNGPQAVVNSQITGTQVASVGSHPSPQTAAIRQADLDPGVNAKAILAGSLENDLEPVVTGGRLIEQKSYRTSIAGHPKVSTADFQVIQPGVPNRTHRQLVQFGTVDNRALRISGRSRFQYYVELGTRNPELGTRASATLSSSWSQRSGPVARRAWVSS